MSQGDIYVGSMPQFRFTFKDEKGVVQDITGGTLTARFVKPDNETFDKSLTIISPGTGGQAKYDTEDTSILNMSAQWKVQGKAVLGGKTFYDQQTFTVKDTY
jgi:hypothetical protein